MFLKILVAIALTLPSWSVATTINDDLVETDTYEETTQTRDPKHKDFLSVNVYGPLAAEEARIFENVYVGRNLTVSADTLLGRNLTVEGDTIIKGDTIFEGDTTFTGTITSAGDLTVTGTLTAENAIINNNLTINGTVNGGNLIHSPGSTTTNALARYADDTGTWLDDSSVFLDNAGNLSGVADIEIDSISKNGNTVSWPSMVGAAGTFLGSDGSGNLVYTTPGAGGNVSATVPFTTDDRIVTTDFASGATNIKQSPITLNSSGNINGVNTLTASTINAALNGNASSATTAISFSGPLLGQVTGNQGSTVVSFVGSTPTSNIEAATALVATATSNTVANTLVKRDGSGGFNSNTITANQFVGPLTGNVTGNATSADFVFSSTNFSGSLDGDVIGTQLATTVSLVGGAYANTVAAATAVVAAATNSNTPSTLVLRDGSGNFNAGTITASITGDVTGNLFGNATTATSFTGPLVGDVIGTQNLTTVTAVGGKTSTEIAQATSDVQAATDTLTPDTIIKRAAVTSNFSAGTITANLVGNVTGNASTATSATNATTAVNFSGSLSGDVTGNQGTTNVIFIGNGGMTAEDVIEGATLAKDAISANTFGAIVRRNGAGDFNGSTITATQFSGPLTGNVSGNLTGNADTATTSIMSDTTQWFSVDLDGDVKGSQRTTSVYQVGGVLAAAVASGTTLANNATANDTPNYLVKRDGTGHFSTHRITLDTGAISAGTDAVTKDYVLSVAGSGIDPKTPALVTSIANTSTAGLSTPIDGVTLSVNDRVLLTAQNYQINNGLWLAQSSNWTRPNDFNTGDIAGNAYVLTSSGINLVGTGWLCNTPLAVIGTDTVNFVQFTSPGKTTGANVGTGVGEVFRDKTGVTLNFKTLAQGNFVNITNGDNELTLAVTATSDNTANTIVSRDAAGNFSATTLTANLTGAASQNVLKTGDTMTGNLILASQKEVRWAQDAGGTNYVGFKAPASGIPYTIALPGTAPVAGQFLRAATSVTTTWTTVDAPPAATKTYYVSLDGNDANDGSLSAPLRTVKYALTQANTVASSSNPVAISVGAGIFVEDNSGGGSLQILADGISIFGSSISSTIITPQSLSDDLFTVTVANTEISNLSLQSTAGSTASAITITTNTLGSSIFNTLSITSFKTGINASSSTGLPVLQLLNNSYANNETCIALANVRALVQSSLFRGRLDNTPGNIGIKTMGTLAQSAILDCFFTAFQTALLTDGGSNQRVIASNIESTINGAICSGNSKCQLVGMNFILNDVTSVNVTATGVGTKVYLEGCLFDCENALDEQAGTAIKVVDGAEILANACTIEEALIGLECGTSADTASTVLHATGISIIETTTSILKKGSSSFHFVGGSFDANTIVIENSTNVDFAAFNINNTEAHLSLGQTSDSSQTIYQILNGQLSLPDLGYEPNYYGYKGTVYRNPNDNPTFSAVQATSNNAAYYVVTGDRTKEASVNLLSDTGNFGDCDNVRGWCISKQPAQADLAFTFTNSDSSSLALRGANTIMNLNGFDNQVEFPSAINTPLPTNTVAKLVWATDTNLYRGAANTLQTDDDLVVGGLSANQAIATDVSKKLVSSATTDTELGYLSGVTSSIQSQINSKVAKAGDTMTGILTHPAGSAATPAIQFAGSTNTGFSAETANRLSFATNSAERMSIDSVGTVAINQFTSTGIVHNSAAGVLSSSLIVDADISPSAAIVDTKLATISTPGKVLDSATTATSENIPNTIVKRDASGNFAAGVITGSFAGNFTGSASLNVLKSGDTMTGTFTAIAGSTTNPGIQFTGGSNTGISSPTANKLSFDTNGVERMSIASTGTIVASSAFVLGNLLCNQAIQTHATDATSSVAANTSTSILLITASTTAAVTITFPGNPLNGQLFTIVSTNNERINLTNVAGAGGATFPNTPITRLEADANFSSGLNGASVTYIYSSATNAWLKFLRG